jgi:hypothetical protein
VLAKVDFALEKKLALMLAMDVPRSVILEKLGLSKVDFESYIADEDFKRIVSLYKDEFNQSQLENKMRENDAMLEYLVKRKLLNLSDILDKDLEFIHEQITNNKDVWEARDFINSLNALASLANVIRQLLRDVSWVVNDSNRLDLEKSKFSSSGFGDNAVLTPEFVSQLRGIIKDIDKEG